MIWNPGQSLIEHNERIGRRRFESTTLAAAHDQPPEKLPELTHFWDRKGNPSVDRLGRSGIDGRVVRCLQRLAVKEGQARGKKFLGWYTVQAKFILEGLHKHTFVLNPAPLKENPYHAEIGLNDLDRELAAFNLREIFIRRGGFQHPLTEQGRTGED